MHPRLVPFNFDYHIQVIVCNSACLTRAGLSELREGGGPSVKMGFYVDISWESKCNIEINV